MGKLKWKEIVAFKDNGQNHVVAIKKDGSVVTTATSEFWTCNVSDWNLLEGPVLELQVEEGASDTRSVGENYTNMTIGDKGEDVQRLQQALLKQGYLSGKADGDFGKKTEEAVKKAQKAFGMDQTGIADDAFQKRLFGEWQDYSH